jgi:hypothetical protein
LTVDQDRELLRRREADGEQRRSFTYALFDLGETELLGCVDIDPAPGDGATAAVSWWVVDWLVGSPIERALDEVVPCWMAADWPLSVQRGVVTRPMGSPVVPGGLQDPEHVADRGRRGDPEAQ